MSKIYLVTEGEDSGYCVLGVYSTRENADHACRVHRTKNSVEEYELDALPEHPNGYWLYSVVIKRDGTATADPYGDDYYELAFWPPCVVNSNDPEWQEQAEMAIWARDEKHAIKIANERRIMLLANGQWDIGVKERIILRKDMELKENWPKE